VTVRFSVSWTAACNQLRNLDLIDSRERELLVENDLRRGELLEFGERFTVELDPPSVPPAYASAVIETYRRKRLTPARAVELLHDTIGEADLPDADDTSTSGLAELGRSRDQHPVRRNCANPFCSRRTLERVACRRSKR